jgi:hypothetical protein
VLITSCLKCASQGPRGHDGDSMEEPISVMMTRASAMSRQNKIANESREFRDARWLAQQECYTCGVKGHLARNCQKRVHGGSADAPGGASSRDGSRASMESQSASAAWTAETPDDFDAVDQDWFYSVQSLAVEQPIAKSYRRAQEGRSRIQEERKHEGRGRVQECTRI